MTNSKTPTPAELQAANEIVGVLNDSEYGEHFHFEDREEIRKIIAPIISTELHLDEVREALNEGIMEFHKMASIHSDPEFIEHWEAKARRCQRALEYLTK